MNKLLVCLFILNFSFNTQAKTFSAADLMDPALAENCIDYCVDGVCFWLLCTLWGCSVNTTVHINHNLPDFILTSYNNPDENPFDEVRELDQIKIDGAIDGGNLGTKKSRGTNSNIKFKEVSVIGNPIAYSLDQFDYICKSAIKAYKPYYLSTLDSSWWRSGITELLYPSTYVLGMNEVGESAFNSWGSVYPRQGFIYQTHDVKASSVIAARALDIVTEGGVHIHQSADCGGNDRHKCYGFKEDGKWQMVSPKAEKSCRAFGKESVEKLKEKIDDKGQYAWTAWRNYGCCVPGRGFYIGSVITGCSKSKKEK